MANAFETPMAANPISQFAQLPLEFIDKSIQRRQDKFDVNKAKMEEQQSLYDKVQARNVDKARKNELVAEYEKAFDNAVERVGGDYSRIGGELDVLKRKFKEDISTGELGAINKNYQSVLQDRAHLKELYEKGKIGYSGYQTGVMKGADFGATQQDKYGDWNSFTGYTPSSVTDPMKLLSDSADEIVARYTNKGMKNIDPKRVANNVYTKLKENPAALQAMRENYNVSNSDLSFTEYVSKTVQQIASDKSYAEKAKSLSGAKGADAQAAAFGDMNTDEFQMTAPGNIQTMKGGTVPGLREAGAAMGFDTFKEFKDWTSSQEGKREIEYMEKRTGTKMPTDPYEAQEWVQNAYNNPTKSELQMKHVPKGVASRIVSDSGNLKTRGRVYDRAGNVVEDLSGIVGKDKESGNKAEVIGIVDEGGSYPYGSYIILGKDGETYIQEPSHTEAFEDPRYITSSIRSAQFSPTGRKTITLPRNAKSNGMVVPAGEYIVQHVPNKGYELISPTTGKRVGVMTESGGIKML